MSLEELKRIKQGTVRWCFHRGLFTIHKGIAERTGLANLCIQALSKASVDRKQAEHYGDFTAVIRHLAEVARYERIAAQKGKKMQIVSRGRAAAA